MPFSPSTRIFGAVIVAMIAVVLLWPDPAVQRWGVAASLVLPLLIWLLTSRAVRDAAPFDDTAFHRTRPPSNSHVFWRVVRFHLLILAGISLSVLGYCWINNLGWPELLHGLAFLILPLIAVMSVFGITASLASSRQHRAGWSYVNLLLIPAGLFLWFVLSFPNYFSMGTLRIMCLTGSLFYPPIWWLVAAKRRRLPGTLLGMAVGVCLPWLPYAFGAFDGIFSFRMNPLATSEFSVRRVATNESVDPVDSRQARISGYLRVSGLGPDEFVSIRDLTVQLPNRTSGFIRTDPTPGNIAGASFAADDSGRLIPASTAFLQAAERDVGSDRLLQIWDSKSSFSDYRESLDDALRTPAVAHNRRTMHGANVLPSTQSRPWSVAATVYRWKKLGEIPAGKGGRIRLPDGGLLQIRPIEGEASNFWISFQVLKGFYDANASFSHGPAVIATDPSGSPTLLKLVWAPSPGSLLTNGQSYEFSGEIPYRDKNQETFVALRNSRLQIYWPVFRGFFGATLPAPD